MFCDGHTLGSPFRGDIHLEHAPDCPWLAIPQIVAAASAAEQVRQRWDALCACVDECEPDDMTACSERHDALDQAVSALVERLR